MPSAHAEAYWQAFRHHRALMAPLPGYVFQDAAGVACHLLELMVAGVMRYMTPIHFGPGREEPVPETGITRSNRYPSPAAVDLADDGSIVDRSHRFRRIRLAVRPR
jgi:hypothetical protein